MKRIGKLKQMGLLVLVVGLSMVIAENANSAGYLKIGDIKGESTDEGHKDWINILSISQSIKRTIPEGATGATRTRGETTLGDVVVVKELDKSSPKLAEACITGQVIPLLEIEITRTRDGKQEPYLTYTLSDVLVTSYSVSGSGVGDGTIPTDQFSLNFEEIKVTYTSDEVDPATGETVKGNVEYEWKIEEGES